MQVTKYVLPVVVGAMAAMALIMLGQTWIITMVGGVDTRNADLANQLRSLPANVFVLLLVYYVICSFAAGIIATLVARRILVRPAIVVGIVLTLAGLYNAMHLPHPVWFMALNFVIYLPFTLLGYLVVRRKPADSSE